MTKNGACLSSLEPSRLPSGRPLARRIFIPMEVHWTLAEAPPGDDPAHPFPRRMIPVAIRSVDEAMEEAAKRATVEASLNDSSDTDSTKTVVPSPTSRAIQPYCHGLFAKSDETMKPSDANLKDIKQPAERMEKPRAATLYRGMSQLRNDIGRVFFPYIDDPSRRKLVYECLERNRPFPKIEHKEIFPINDFKQFKRLKINLERVAAYVPVQPPAPSEIHESLFDKRGLDRLPLLTTGNLEEETRSSVTYETVLERFYKQKQATAGQFKTKVKEATRKSKCWVERNLPKTGATSKSHEGFVKLDNNKEMFADFREPRSPQFFRKLKKTQPNSGSMYCSDPRTLASFSKFRRWQLDRERRKHLAHEVIQGRGDRSSFGSPSERVSFSSVDIPAAEKHVQRNIALQRLSEPRAPFNTEAKEALRKFHRL